MKLVLNLHFAKIAISESKCKNSKKVTIVEEFDVII